MVHRIFAAAIAMLFFLIAVGASKPAAAQDACGSPRVKYTVKQVAAQPPPPQPEPGKALVFVVEHQVSTPAICVHCAIATRVAVDGQWVGAGSGDSWFAFSLAPGPHHLCAMFQARFSSTAQDKYFAPLTVESGKTYYIETRVEALDNQYQNIRLLPLNEEEGKDRVQTFPFSDSHRK